MAENPTASNHDSGDQSHRHFLWVSLAIGLGVFVLWCVLGYVVPKYIHPDKPDGDKVSIAQNLRGTLGDQFGAVNALFSGLAFAGVVTALFMQQKAARKAADQHSVEMALQRQLLDEQLKQQRLQMVADMLDDMRSVSFGRAHRTLSKWKADHADDFAERFGRERILLPPCTDEVTLDDHRRVFIKTFHKAWRLKQVGLLDEQTAKEIIDPVYAHALLEISRPMEAAIRSNYCDTGFKWVEELWTEHERTTLGTYAPPSLGP